MTHDGWQVVSEWLGEWIAADADRREHLRVRLATEHPNLLEEAEALAHTSSGLRGFLETPALVLEAADIVSDDRDLPAGTTIGPYRITGLIARGGSGDVYRATHVRLHREVALKVLAQSRTDDPKHGDRFLREARVTASLDHPHVVRIYDVGHADGHTYLATELLEGETLRAPIARGPIRLDDALRIACEVASGLAAAHAAGLVHRDLKPDNVFLTGAGGTKILDFGIAKLVPEHTDRGEYLTMTGVVLGTSGYLAPEQILGSSVDPRADLFALGILLFEMLTGVRAFERAHLLDTLHAIVHDPPADAFRTREDVPPDVRAIVMRLLEKAPDARFQSAQAVIAALQRVRSVANKRLPGNRKRSVRVLTALSARAVVLAGLVVVVTAGAVAMKWRRLPAFPVAATTTATRAPNEEAAEKVRLGRVAVRRPTPEDLRMAETYFNDAVAIDPQYADAWAGLASVYKRKPIVGAAPAKLAFVQARDHATRALEIDPANAEAFSALGTIAFWYDWKYDLAEKLLQRALAEQPGHADSSLFLAHLYSNLGRSEEALARIKLAQSHDQQWAHPRALQGQFLYMARKYEDAVHYLDQAKEIDPGSWTTHLFRADALLARGQTRDALAGYDSALGLSRHPMPLVMRGVTLARMHRIAEAEQLLVKIPPEFHYGRALLLHALRRDNQAIEALQAAVDAKHPLVTFLGVDPQWDDLRNLEAFREVVRQVNLLGVSDKSRLRRSP